jgi:CBS domain-containing protein
MSAHGQEFDFSSPPFDLLTPEQARVLASAIDIEFVPRGTRLLEEGAGSSAMYVILKGGIAAVDERDGVPRTFSEFGPSDYFGATAVLAGRARHNYEAIEDTLLWVIPAAAFRKAVESNGRFAAHFVDSLAKRTALAETTPAGPSDLGELMLTKVGDALLGEAVVVPEDCALDEAARRMRDKHVDCVFVSGERGLGIATRTDLLESIALKHLALDRPVGEIASRPVVGCSSDEPLFQALVTMTRRRIERIAVFDGDRILGTLGLVELLSHYSSHSHVIGLRVARASTREELAAAAREINGLVRTLYANGARMQYLAELVSVLNQRLMSRLFEFCFDEETRARCCLVVMGSEGRGEQLLKTDQDNGLVLAAGLPDAAVAEGARAFSEGLAAMGYPPCPGGVMVSNTAWRGDGRAWIERISSLRGDTSSDGLMRAAIMIDAQPVAGDLELFEPVRDALLALGRDALWLHQFVLPAIEFSAPLTLFGGLRGKGSAVDLKKGGIFPVVHGVRLMAVERGLRCTSTFDRLDALVGQGALSTQLGTDLRQAFAIMLRLRLGQQLEAVREGEVPTNDVQVGRMRRLDRELLRDALRIVKDFQSFLSSRYRRGV